MIQRIIGLTILAVSLWSLSGCAAPAPTVAPLPTLAIATPSATNGNRPPQTFRLEDVSITLERTPCFGACPTYTVTLQGDGTVKWNGQDHVKVKGAQESELRPQRVFDLLKQFYAADFFNFREEYVVGHDLTLESDGSVVETTMMITDLPTAIVTLKIGDYLKKVKGYYGMPQEFTTLAEAIDETTGTAAWIK